MKDDGFEVRGGLRHRDSIPACARRQPLAKTIHRATTVKPTECSMLSLRAD